MSTGRRPASAPIQLVALVMGILDGLVVFYAFVGLLMAVLPSCVLVWLCVAACAYFLAAPASWRGLWRRALGTLGLSLLLFAALGYLFEFVGLPAGGMPDLAPLAQVTILVIGAASVAGSRALRDRRQAFAPEAPTSSEPPANPSAGGT